MVLILCNFLIFVYNVNLCVTVTDKYSSNLIVVISNVSRLKIYNVCDLFHSQGMYLNIVMIHFHKIQMVVYSVLP
jgi:hypothetical protein